MLTTETIAGISTGLINSGISIIKISGPKSILIIKDMFSNYNKLEPNKIVYGNIFNINGNLMDKVLVSYFKAPNSYTGEDVCEINCHGGKQITLEILEEVLKRGAILASPGEFSKRAFLNGKMDLSQAEAVIDLINSKSKLQNKIAMSQLEGNLAKKIKGLRSKLLELIANIEVGVDYPEYEYEELSYEKIFDIIKDVNKEVSKLIKEYEDGKYLKDGINMAILGVPNVGKSSLLNLLSKSQKAIVTDIPGTTRDIIEEQIIIDDLVINVFDTAGIRQTEDVVEKIGVDKAIAKLEEVDLVIYMISASNKISKEDLETLSIIQNKGLKVICAINKIDRSEKSIFEANLKQLTGIGIENIINISVLEEIGITELKNKIKELFNKNNFDYNDEFLLINTRHKNLLVKASESLNNLINDLNNKKEVDILSIEITNVLENLGEIIGANISEDILNKLFESFCIGK